MVLPQLLAGLRHSSVFRYLAYSLSEEFVIKLPRQSTVLMTPFLSSPNNCPAGPAAVAELVRQRTLPVRASVQPDSRRGIPCRAAMRTVRQIVSVMTFVVLITSFVGVFTTPPIVARGRTLLLRR